MHWLPSLVFIAITITALVVFFSKIREIRRNILLGREANFSDNRAARWKNLFLLALGQKKMFRYPGVAVLHLLIYVGFIVINLEILEIICDGLLHKHRVFHPYLGSAYPLLINAFELLAVGVIVACILFLIRRNLLGLKRFSNAELDGWPRSDAHLILIIEIVLMTLFLSMNASDRALQLRQHTTYVNTGPFLVSGQMAALWMNFSTPALVGIERTCWWLHILGIYAFLNYLPWSKHLHILLAFPNAYYARLAPAGTMNNMPVVQQEVGYALHPETAPTTTEPVPRFGAKDVTDLSWRNLLDAYSCTECGRCTAACPASYTGKKLSPRRIMMATRDRLEELGNTLNEKKKVEDNPHTLLHHYITPEEVQACTSCNACVEECPVSISPLEIILELRRSLVMEESKAPQEWNTLYANLENNFAPWKFSPDDRDAWRNNA